MIYVKVPLTNQLCGQIVVGTAERKRRDLEGTSRWRRAVDNTTFQLMDQMTLDMIMEQQATVDAIRRVGSFLPD